MSRPPNEVVAIYAAGMTTIRVLTPLPGIIHLLFPNQVMLCKSFMRLQEYYESPIGDFRGRYFTRDEFKEAYAEENDCGTGFGEFSYYDEWNGFNVPGNVVDKFMDIFDIDFMEETLVRLIKANRPREGRYYVIGTHDQDSYVTLNHEIAHALWYLDGDYHKEQLAAVKRLPGRFYVRACNALREAGYHDDVFDDEIHAYLSTSSMVELSDFFEIANLPWRKIYLMQRYFHNYVEMLDEQQQETVSHAD